MASGLASRLIARRRELSDQRRLSPHPCKLITDLENEARRSRASYARIVAVEMFEEPALEIVGLSNVQPPAVVDRVNPRRRWGVRSDRLFRPDKAINTGCNRHIRLFP